MSDQPKEHKPDCRLYPAHWLRHALAALEELVAGDP
jgi:hypothetical protein